ncbi:acetylcholine receptor subunit beta-like [Haliotis asinina]|uniref:acetylcholine receptor subunit beta-like n=1 Tax=Haliotis asinina TaxID=109174 RepID=UPI0035320761
MECYTRISMYLLMFVFLGARSDSDIRDSLSHLRRDLLGRQDKAVPPFKGNSTSVDVSLSFTPMTILDLNSVTQVLSVVGYLKMAWIDSRLTWDDHNLTGVDMVEVGNKDIWTPPIFIGNSVSNLEPVETKLPLIVSPSGYVRWQVIDVFRTECKINVSRFPFDTQRCRLLLTPPYGYSINITIDDDHIPGENVLGENGEWKTRSVSKNLSSIKTFKIAEYIFTFDRKYVYHLINFIFPMGIISVLNPFVFLIPARSGEKLGFLMAVFVSHTMFLNLIHSNMPPTSDSTSRLSLYLLLNEIQGFLTIFASIVVLVVHHLKEMSQTKAIPSEDKTPTSIPGKTRNWERFLDCIFFAVSLIMAGCSILIMFM